MRSPLPSPNKTPHRLTSTRWRLVPGLAIALCVTAIACAQPDDERGLPRPSSFAELSPAKLERLASLYLKLGQTDDCRAALEAMLHDAPKNPAGLRLTARLELKLGRYEKCIAAASSVLAVSPDDEDAMVLKSEALRAQGHAAEANALIAQVNADDLAQREEQLGLTPPRAITDKAGASAAESARERADELADAAFEQARNALKNQNLRHADALTAYALTHWPQDNTAIELRADFLASADRPAEAIPLFRKLKQAHAPSSEPFARQIDLAFALNDAGLTDEARREFQVVLNDAAFSHEDRDSAARALAAKRTAALLAEGAAALGCGDNAKARRICEQLVKEHEVSDDFREFHADVLEATGKHEEAAGIYAALKRSAPRGKRFDSQMGYANALSGSMEYQRASYALEEVVASPWLYTLEENSSAREELQELHEKHFPNLASEFVAGSYEEGRVWRLKSQVASMSSGKWRYFSNIERDWITLDEKVFPTRKTARQISATIGIGREFSPTWSGSLFVGGCDDGIMASIAADYTNSRGLTAIFRFAWNDPARDSLLLEAMQGRQHSLSADISSPLGKYFAFESTLLARQIEVEGDSIGRSIGMEAQLRWHPFTVEKDTWLAYALELKTFSANTASFNRHVRDFFGTSDESRMPAVYDAVPKLINRHALQAHTSTPLTDSLVAAVTAEAAWRQEEKKIEYAITGELNWKVTRRCEINARLEYETGGAGANSNGSVTIGTLGVKYSW